MNFLAFEKQEKHSALFSISIIYYNYSHQGPVPQNLD